MYAGMGVMDKWNGVGAMSKTLIDLDDDLIDRAAEFLGTKTKKDTVNGALAEYVKLNLRIRFGERLASGGLPDLADPEVMAEVRGRG